MTTAPEVSRPLHAAASRVYAGWPATEVDDGRGFTIDVEGSTGAWSALVLTDDDDAVFCFYSLSPVGVPEGDAAATARMSELVDRANLGLVAGTFELDRDSGQVRLRTGLELGALPASLREDPVFLEALVRDLSAANIGLMDRYLSALVAVTSSGLDVAAIVRDVETGDSPA